MPVFELESGRLIPAQFGRTVEGALPEPVLASVRAQVLEIIARPLFPITWRDLSRGADGSDSSPRLTALDATGQVVAVEVLSHLTSQALISALSRLADVAALSWMDLAREFPGGIEQFRLGWMAFRDAMPSSPGAGPRLIMVVHSMDADARAALEVLSASGVEVHELSCRQMANGRLFVDVNPVGPRVYAHIPQLLGQQSSVEAISAPPAAPEDGRGVSAEQKIDTSAGEERIAGVHEEVAPEIASAEGEPFVRHRSAPLYPRVRAAVVVEPSLSDTESEIEAAARAHEAAAHSSVDQVETSSAKSPQLQADHRALQVIAALAGEDVPLVMRGSRDLREPMVLCVDGVIRVGERSFVDVNEALAYNGHLSEDGWRELFLADPLGPTLREALQEVNADIERSYHARH